MTKEELAARLNGREYGHEITPEEEAEAKASGIVVIFGASDDIVELRGAVNDEKYDLDLFFDSNGLVQNKCEDDCPYFKKLAESITDTVSAKWDTDGYAWVFRTNMPHATFDTMEDGEKYCRGIVFELPKGDKP
jgi:hypothetical protein